MPSISHLDLHMEERVRTIDALVYGQPHHARLKAQHETDAVNHLTLSDFSLLQHILTQQTYRAS